MDFLWVARALIRLALRRSFTRNIDPGPFEMTKAPQFAGLSSFGITFDLACVTIVMMSAVMAMVARLGRSNSSCNCEKGKENKGAATNHLQGRSSRMAKPLMAFSARTC